MRVRLETRVEVDGATFWFGAADQTLGPLVGLFKARLAETGEETLDETQLPPDMIAPLCALFMEGVRRWEGVIGEEGLELFCTPLAMRDFPTMQKLQVAAAYLNTWAALQGNAPPSG